MAMDNVEEDADSVYQGILGEIGLEYSLDNPVRTSLDIKLTISLLM